MTHQPGQISFDLATALNALPGSRLEDMAIAGQTVHEMMRLLKKSGQNLVGQCLAGQGTFYQLDHYPKGDVYDKESHSQYYYHAHRPEAHEHGHFHTFLRASGMPSHIQPVPYTGKARRPEGRDALTHFVAISMDRPGNPIGLFTTNRWVTDETFYRAEDVISLIDRFDMNMTYPCLALNRTLSAMFRLFRPQIEALLIERDRTIAHWIETHPDSDVYEDRQLEVTSHVAISIDGQREAVAKALAGQATT